MRNNFFGDNVTIWILEMDRWGLSKFSISEMNFRAVLAPKWFDRMIFTSNVIDNVENHGMVMWCIMNDSSTIQLKFLVDVVLLAGSFELFLNENKKRSLFDIKLWITWSLEIYHFSIFSLAIIKHDVEISRKAMMHTKKICRKYWLCVWNLT